MSVLVEFYGLRVRRRIIKNGILLLEKGKRDVE